MVSHLQIGEPWWKRNISKVTGGNVSTGTRCLESRGPFWTTFVAKSSCGYRFECGYWLVTCRNIASVFMVPWSWKFRGFHNIWRYFYFLTDFCSTGTPKIGHWITSFTIKFAYFFIASWRWIIVFCCHIMIMEKVDFVAHWEANGCLPKRLFICVVCWPRVSWIWISLLFRIYNGFSKILSTSTKTMRLISLLESWKSWKACNALIRIKKWWNLIGTGWWPWFFWVFCRLETVAHT